MLVQEISILLSHRQLAFLLSAARWDSKAGQAYLASHKPDAQVVV